MGIKENVVVDCAGGSSALNVHLSLSQFPQLECPCGSYADGQSEANGAVLNKLMTAKLPASAVIMEIAADAQRMGMRAFGHFWGQSGGPMNWLTTLGRYSPAGSCTKRVEVTLPEGQDGENTFNRCIQQKRRTPQEKLRVADPWWLSGGGLGLFTCGSYFIIGSCPSFGSLDHIAHGVFHMSLFVYYC